MREIDRVVDIQSNARQRDDRRLDTDRPGSRQVRQERCIHPGERDQRQSQQRDDGYS